MTLIGNPIFGSNSEEEIMPFKDIESKVRNSEALYSGDVCGDIYYDVEDDAPVTGFSEGKLAVLPDEPKEISDLFVQVSGQPYQAPGIMT